MTAATTEPTFAARAAEVLAPLATGLEHERAWLVPFDEQGKAGKPVHLSSGDEISVGFSDELVFREISKPGVDRWVIAHNHPLAGRTLANGDEHVIEPSHQDVATTQGLLLKSMLFGLPPLADHVILDQQGNWISMVEFLQTHKPVEQEG